MTKINGLEIPAPVCVICSGTNVNCCATVRARNTRTTTPMETDNKDAGVEAQIEQGISPLPWHINAHGYDSPYLSKAFIETGMGDPICGLYEGDDANARMILTAVNSLPALLQVVERAKALAASCKEYANTKDIAFCDNVSHPAYCVCELDALDSALAAAGVKTANDSSCSK